MPSTIIEEQLSVSALEIPERLLRTTRPPRPFTRRLLQLFRRTHLYLGLFLFPWAMLYGVTGFLFNHPTFLADSATTSFIRADLIGTAIEQLPSLEEQANAVLAALNDLKKPATPFRLTAGEIRYANRETFIATVRSEQRTFVVTLDPKTASGVIRETTSTNAGQVPAPFATGQADVPRQRGMGMMGPMKHDHSGVKVSNSLADRIKSSIPTLMERKGFPSGDVTITTSPDIRFPIDADGRTWIATYNPLTTSVRGTTGTEAGELSFRSFLLRMHLTRGYPGELNTKWLWALGVDAIALTLCFWGLSGLLMWWQIKATRKAGLIVLLLSGLLAVALGIGMHGLLAG